MQNNFELKTENMSHSIMLVSQDEKALFDFSFVLAKKLLCKTQNACGTCSVCKKIEHKNHADVLVFPKEKDVISVDDILGIVEDALVFPFEADKKVYILNNFSFTSGLVQNKLLKTLEEPPKHVYFVLNVTNETKVLPTIKSRCQKIYLPKFEDEQIFESLNAFQLSDEQKQDIVSYCEGMKSKAESFANDSNFEDTLNLTFDVWKNLRTSPQVLDYASKFYTNKKLFEEFLFLYGIMLKEVLHAKLKETNLLKDKKRKELFEQIANDFSFKALSEIEKECIVVAEKLERNCNQFLVVDNFLLKILEVRAKWQ